jgi:nucleoid DNA-binding protein
MEWLAWGRKNAAQRSGIEKQQISIAFFRLFRVECRVFRPLLGRYFKEGSGLPARKKSAQKKSFSFPKASAPRTKGEVYRLIAEATELPRKDVANVFAALTALIGQDVAKPGVFTLPGLAKIYVVQKPATKARKGINPFTKEEMIFKAKPARKVVKVRALAGLKGFVS